MTELRPGRADVDKAHSTIELVRMRIGHDVQIAGPKRNGQFDGSPDESSADARAPEVRLDEQSIQFCIAVFTSKHDGETHSYPL